MCFRVCACIPLPTLSRDRCKCNNYEMKIILNLNREGWHWNGAIMRRCKKRAACFVFLYISSQGTVWHHLPSREGNFLKYLVLRHDRVCPLNDHMLTSLQGEKVPGVPDLDMLPSLSEQLQRHLLSTYMDLSYSVTLKSH